MLVWLKIFLLIFFGTFFSLSTVHTSLLFLILHSELLLITLFFLFVWAAVFLNINYAVGLALCYLVLGGLELALGLLLFTL